MESVLIEFVCVCVMHHICSYMSCWLLICAQGRSRQSCYVVTVATSGAVVFRSAAVYLADSVGWVI